MRSPAPGGIGRGIRGRLAWIAGGAAALAVVVTFAAALGVLGRVPFVGQFFPGAGWQIYRDPTGLFTVQMPPGWTGHYSDQGSATEGDQTTSVTIETYATTLGDPPDSTATFKFAVSYWPLPNAFARQWQCQQRQQLDTTIDGLPAEHGGGTVYDPLLLDTEAAHYQIDYVLGDGLPISPVLHAK